MALDILACNLPEFITANHWKPESPKYKIYGQTMKTLKSPTW